MKIPGFELEPFTAQEFVPKAIFSSFGKNSIWFIDIRNVQAMVFLRHYFDAQIILNNWSYGGDLNHRVYRPPHIKPKGGGALSQHYKSIADDFNVKGLAPKQVAQRLIDDWETIRSNTFFTTIEDPEATPTWTHIDGRWTDQAELLIVGKPR
jgi:hypothetical protein